MTRGTDVRHWNTRENGTQGRVWDYQHGFPMAFGVQGKIQYGLFTEYWLGCAEQLEHFCFLDKKAHSALYDWTLNCSVKHHLVLAWVCKDPQFGKNNCCSILMFQGWLWRIASSISHWKHISSGYPYSAFFDSGSCKHSCGEWEYIPKGSQYMNVTKIWVRGDGDRYNCAAMGVRGEGRAKAERECLPHSLIQPALTEHPLCAKCWHIHWSSQHWYSPLCAKCCSRHGHRAWWMRMMTGDGCVKQGHSSPLIESAMGAARQRGGLAPLGVEDLCCMIMLP